MYRKRSELSFTTAYIGIVVADSRAPVGYYDTLVKKRHSKIGAWYFEHDHGVVWIASGGEHAEPLTEWLHNAHLVLRCTTMLAAVVNNGAKQPPRNGFLFYIDRRSMTDAQEQLLQGSYTIYLPHCDQFMVLAEFKRYWEVKQTSSRLHAGQVVNSRAAFRPPAPRLPRPGHYDPIEAQIREVLGSVSETARQAASDLLADWKESLGEPIPGDIQNLQTQIDDEKRRILEARDDATPDLDLSTKIDSCAQSLRSMRRTAFELRARIRDYEWSPHRHATYEKVSTPMMLRALQRYAADLAEQLGINSYLLPVVGEEFSTSTEMPVAPLGTRKTDVIEVPPEIRLRLGAVPMIAHPVVQLLGDRLENLVKAIVEISPKRYPHLANVVPRFEESGKSYVFGDFELHRPRQRRVALDVAADLVSCVITGPPYVFARARFAVGNLGEPAAAAPEDSPSFRLRLGMCLGLLKAIGREAEFNSVYYKQGPLEIPDNVVKEVKKIPRLTRRWPEANIAAITNDLRAGRIVRAHPTAILIALWRAVAARSGYLNEVAALVSVATS